MAYYKVIARLSHSSYRFLKKLTDFLDALSTGFWLGVMGEKSIDFSGELSHSRNKYYTDDKYNQSGFFGWEKAVIEKHFSNVKTILLIAAGGGRETLALSRMGYDVDSYECNPALIEYGNMLLQKNSINNKIKYLPADSVPGDTKKYDGIIVGWGAYSLIPGSKKRLSFLKGLYPFLLEGAPLMISFLWMEKRGRRDRIISNVSNFFRIFSRNGKTEPGDRLEPEYIHFFTEEEIKSELIQSKFRIIYYNVADYGCIIAGI
ncbi:MAG: hypothetical protein WAW07_06890 [Bacteroidales bacterium]